MTPVICLACDRPSKDGSTYCSDCSALSHFERILLTHLAYIKEALYSYGFCYGSNQYNDNGAEQAIHGDLCNK